LCGSNPYETINVADGRLLHLPTVSDCAFGDAFACGALGFSSRLSRKPWMSLLVVVAAVAAVVQ
jgi:hypothetical protein